MVTKYFDCSFFSPSSSEEIFNSVVLMDFQIFEIACWRGKKTNLITKNKYFDLME